ncbi:hypothetical protein [Halorhabdus sp. CUG00001]|uniref:hypothetical protein n=1 Tax=Halorhabdus sp. CUG00001 TaxID=2600297 RepID=UPI00131C2665|nr:hypothetical protein [Halorhabdus sp. CUG00001]
MSAGNDQLRTELSRKFQPPIDVLLDPSLLVAKRSFERLADSTVFESQRQATLGRTITEPRLGDLYVPGGFQRSISNTGQSPEENTNVWDFYRGKADAISRDDIVDLIDQNNVDQFSNGGVSIDPNWKHAIDDPDRHERLRTILEEELSFLQSGGIILARTSSVFEVLRDAGVLTIDIGDADLDPDLQETLFDIGYTDPAQVCAFGISTAGSTADALSDYVLKSNTDLIIYRIGN